MEFISENELKSEVEKLKDLRQEIKRLEHLEKELAEKIKDYMQNQNKSFLVTDSCIAVLKLQQKERFNTKLFKKQHKNIYDMYLQNVSYQTLNISIIDEE